jgi:hypothetical protein
MSREEHAREGAQTALPGEEILDVAVVMPRGSTVAGVVGATAGVAFGGSNPTAWGVAGSVLAQRAASASKGSYPSLVLALTPERLHVLGRSSTGLVGGWKHLHPVAHIERADLAVSDRHHGTVHVIELTDTTTGTALEFEGQNVGNLGLKDFLEAVRGER